MTSPCDEAEEEGESEEWEEEVELGMGREGRRRTDETKIIECGG